MKKLALRIKNGNDEWDCELMRVTGLNYDAVEKLRDVLFNLDMRTDPDIDAAAREFVETWIKYDGGNDNGLQIRRDENPSAIQVAL